ncbi:hypothetical protein HAX54_023670 [Datura stramonium]|uniref:Xylanase inhibitor C-terminal domain-containing protein n=1 Tax=Datura stramonium TaxID=4076 RepID=A0ABS8UYR9_DATST|nr:hypothetical protein [Datura stramonium]
MGAHLNRRGPAMGSTTTYDAEGEHVAAFMVGNEKTTYCRYNVPYESGIRTIGLMASELNATVFSLCLPSFELGKSSILNFHKAPWPNATMAKLLPNYMHPQLHFVNLYKIFINDREVPSNRAVVAFDKTCGGVVVDTGLLIIHFPKIST